jgi:hypothetical protein
MLDITGSVEQAILESGVVNGDRDGVRGRLDGGNHHD